MKSNKILLLGLLIVISIIFSRPIYFTALYWIQKSKIKSVEKGAKPQYPMIAKLKNGNISFFDSCLDPNHGLCEGHIREEILKISSFYNGLAKVTSMKGEQYVVNVLGQYVYDDFDDSLVTKIIEKENSYRYIIVAKIIDGKKLWGFATKKEICKGFFIEPKYSELTNFSSTGIACAKTASGEYTHINERGEKTSFSH